MGTRSSSVCIMPTAWRKPRTASHSSSGRPVREASSASIVTILGLDVEFGPAGEGQQIIDGHVVLGVGIRRHAGNDRGSRTWPRRDKVVVAQSAQRLADGVAADGEPLTQLVLGGQLRADRIHPVHDLLPECGPPAGIGDRRGRRSCRSVPSEREHAALTVGGDARVRPRPRRSRERALRSENGGIP
jgi:hypothetical protein